MLWHPKGGLMRHLAEEFCKNEHLAGGYDLVYTPHIGRATLWETSGHLGFYKENMYAPIEIEGQEFYLKPMNCPFHLSIYKTPDALATAICRCASPSGARSIGSSAAACCTA